MTATSSTRSNRRGRPRARGSRSDLEPREEILRAAAALFSTLSLIHI